MPQCLCAEVNRKDTISQAGRSDSKSFDKPDGIFGGTLSDIADGISDA